MKNANHSPPIIRLSAPRSSLPRRRPAPLPRSSRFPARRHSVLTDAPPTTTALPPRPPPRCAAPLAVATFSPRFSSPSRPVAVALHHHRHATPQAPRYSLGLRATYALTCYSHANALLSRRRASPADGLPRSPRFSLAAAYHGRRITPRRCSSRPSCFTLAVTLLLQILCYFGRQRQGMCIVLFVVDINFGRRSTRSTS